MKITIFAIYTPWETLENFWFTLPYFPLHDILRTDINSTDIIAFCVLKLISSIPKKNSAFCMKTSYFMNK